MTRFAAVPDGYTACRRCGQYVHRASGATRCRCPGGAKLAQAGPTVPKSAQPSPTARVDGRRWRLDVPVPCDKDGRPLVSNLNHRDRWDAVEATRLWKEAAWAVTVGAQVPRLQHARVTLRMWPPDRRRRDRENLTPCYKAAKDGIVAANVLLDDTPEYVDDGFVVLHTYEGGPRVWRAELEIVERKEP